MVEITFHALVNLWRHWTAMWSQHKKAPRTLPQLLSPAACTYREELEGNSLAQLCVPFFLNSFMEHRWRLLLNQWPPQQNILRMLKLDGKKTEGGVTRGPPEAEWYLAFSYVHIINLPKTKHQLLSEFHHVLGIMKSRAMFSYSP